MKGRVEFIDSKTAGEFLLPKHYSGRISCSEPNLNVSCGCVHVNTVPTATFKFIA